MTHYMDIRLCIFKPFLFLPEDTCEDMCVGNAWCQQYLIGPVLETDT